MLQPGDATADQRQAEKQHAYAEKYLFLERSDFGDERAENQSHDQAANVGSVVGASHHCSEKRLYPTNITTLRSIPTDRGARQRKLAKIKR